jgi:hypothetical protein
MRIRCLRWSGFFLRGCRCWGTEEVEVEVVVEVEV